MNQFDLIVIFFYLRRQLFPALKAALRPGGLLMYRTYVQGSQDAVAVAEKPRRAEHLLRSGELPAVFADFRVWHYQERSSRRNVAEFIAQKAA